MRRPIRIRPLVCAVVLILPSLYAQTAGRISGQILDSSDASVAGANIRAENAATGQKRTAVTDLNGYYAIPNLQIGTYSIRAEKPGFRAAVQKSVHVGVADILTVNLALQPGDVQDVITVSEKVDADIAPGARLEDRLIADLPINGRDFARFSLLTPGATPRSGSMADLPFNGLTIVLNSWSMDGIDASRVDIPLLANGSERGARLLTGSLDTIAELRVQTANYEAQYGRAASAYLNIATRSGGNQWHGNAFSYLRNDFFDARNFFNTRPGTHAPFRYSDFGSNLSGALRRNKTFFFTNYEGSRQRIGVTGSGTTPSSSLRSQTLAQSPALAPILAEFPVGARPTADPRVDSYTTVSISKVREDTGSLRIDELLTAGDTLFLRVNTNDSRVRGPLFAINASALGLLDRQDVPVRTSNVAVHEQHVISPRLLNETLIGLQRVAARYNASTPYPLVNISAISIAPGGNSDQKNISTSYQIGDGMSYTVRTHSLKWGVSAYRIQNDVRTSDFSRLIYSSLEDFIRNSSATAIFSSGIPERSVRGYQLGLYLQDSWRAARNLTVDIGLRYDWEPPVFDPAHLGRPFDTRRQALAEAGSPYYRGNRLNFGPRFASAWRPARRWTVRAGYGIYYEPYPVGYASFSIPQNSLPGNTTLLRQQIPNLGYPIAPFLSPGAAAPPSVTGFNWARNDSYAQQWSVTAALEATKTLTFEAAYLGNHGLKLRRRYNINFFDPAAKQRPNPGFADVIIEANDAESNYHSLQLSVRQRFHRGLGFGLNYTWSHAIDDAGDENVASSQPQDVSNFRAERGNGSADVRQAASFYSSYELPFGRGRQTHSGVKSRMLEGWQIASVGVVRTGVAMTVLIPISQTGNGATSNQRPNVVPGVSPYFRQQTVDGWFNPAAFVLPPAGSFGNLGRNTLFGPGLVQADVSVIKTTKVSESATLQFRGECFNVPNHPNFAQPNAMLGGASFGKIFNTLGRTLGMGTARQIQLAVRLHF